MGFLLSSALQAEASSLEIEKIPSPFARDGEAVVTRVLGDQRKAMIWEVDGVVPGRPYSVSFFFQNRAVKDPRELEVFWLDVMDGFESIYHQRFYPRNHPQFFSTAVVFGTDRAQLRLRLSPGTEIVFGELGRAVEVDDLADVRFPHSSELWPPKLSLPSVYRGLRNFEIEVNLWAGQTGTLAGLSGVEVRAGMNIAASKLPRLLPGQNTLHVVRDTVGEGAGVTADVTVRNGRAEPKITLQADAKIPADGATFGRVFVSAVDAEGELISGGFFRLKTPSQVQSHPFVRAISDWEKMQTTREFHLTSLTPGSYEIGLERWNGSDWVPTHESFVVQFEEATVPAAEFVRLDFARPWLQPREASRSDSPADRIDLAWSSDDGGHEDVLEVPLSSEFSPRVDWTVRGPVKGLSLHTAVQPNARSLGETAASLWARIAQHSSHPARDFALAVEEYVALTIEGVLPEAYYFSDYPSFGRIHREGRGWCNQFASAVHALLIEGGLESRLRNLPDHVTGEVRSDELETMLVDAMLQVAVTDAHGNRTMLDRLDDEGARILGAGVDNETRRGKFSGYLHSPFPADRPWVRRDPSDTKYRNAMRDDRIFSLDLRGWEQISWSSGSVPDLEIQAARGTCAENQTMLTQLSQLEFADFAGDAEVNVSNLEVNENGLLVPTGSSWGKVRFPFQTPIEVDDLFITTKGVLGGGGRISISLRPALSPPLVEGFSEYRIE
ncbi:MAG: hypothetical protein SynsKO_35730 [Synoicihabitans sp.]